MQVIVIWEIINDDSRELWEISHLNLRFTSHQLHQIQTFISGKISEPEREMFPLSDYAVRL